MIRSTIAGFVLTAVAAVASAAPQVTIATRDHNPNLDKREPVRETPLHVDHVKRRIYLVERDEPRMPGKVEVRVVNSTIYLDPDKDYQSQGDCRINNNHHIVQALRIYRARHAAKAYVVHGGPGSHIWMARHPGPREHVVKLRMFTPDGKQHDLRVIPNVPRPAKKTRKIAATDSRATDHHVM